MTKTVLISGASIAGPALAYWLRRYGFEPTIVERAPALREGGYKIDIRGAAVEVVERMGLLDDVKRLSTDIQDGTYVDDAGREVATLDGDLFGFRSGDDVEIMRGDLGRLLYDATKDGVEYVFGDFVTSMTEHDDGVDVTFDRAAPRRFDLVVGADGLHSGVRALTFGDESRFVEGLGAYLSIFSTDNHLGLDRSELMHLGVGRLANMYSTRGSDHAKVFMLFGSEPLDYDRKDVERQRQLLRSAYAGAGWEIPRFLESMSKATDFYFDALSIVRMGSWSKGRTVLVGDAGYCPSPASGQGTSLALVGAYVLAGELATARGDHSTAFPAYEREIRQFVETNLKLGITNAKRMVPKSPAQIRMHHLFLRLLPRLPGKTLMAKAILKSIHGAANAITLKDYEPALV